jgi:hypothetical protein
MVILIIFICLFLTQNKKFAPLDARTVFVNEILLFFALKTKHRKSKCKFDTFLIYLFTNIHLKKVYCPGCQSYSYHSVFTIFD